MSIQDEFDQLLEAKVRTMLQEDINKNAKQTFDVIQRSRAVLEEQFNLIDKEIQSIMNKQSEYAAFLDSKAMPREIAQFEFAQAVTPLFESITGEWAWSWRSDYLQLSTFWMPGAQMPLSNPSQPMEAQEDPSMPNATSINKQAVQSPEKEGRHQTKFSYRFNAHLVPLLEEELSRGILHKISERPRIQCIEIVHKGHVFEWPESNGIFCVIKCRACNVLNTSNPLARGSTLAVQNHWRSTAHPEYKGYALKKLYWEIMTQCTYMVEGVTRSWLQLSNNAIRRHNHKRKQRQRQNPAQIPDNAAMRSADPVESYNDPRGHAYPTTPTERNAFSGRAHTSSSVDGRDGSMPRDSLAWPLRSFSSFENSGARSTDEEQDAGLGYTPGSLQTASGSHASSDSVRKYSDIIAGCEDGEEYEEYQEEDMDDDCNDDLILIRENFIGPTAPAAETESYKTACDIKAEPCPEESARV
ncbi:hypothetical protein PG994_005593 [Apiospora phragmitis]|uniref:Uncharacterized protein n=1 Tax=Apiospora phragmitis TaxID=2905665 RepID=A0ABR1VDP2_9PEZI